MCSCFRKICRKRLVLIVQGLAWIGFVAILPHQAIAQPASLGISTDQIPSFDVVSIRRNVSGKPLGSISMQPSGDGLIATNAPLRRIVEFAFNFRFDDLVSGMPEWARNERYDISAKVAESDLPAYHRLSVQQQREMLQTVLRQRCGLKARIVAEDKAVLALRRSKEKMQVKPIAEEQLPAPSLGPNGEQTHEDPLSVGPGQIRSEGINMDSLVFALSAQHLGRPIVNQTNLKGRYVFTLQWNYEGESLHQAGSVADDSGTTGSFPSLNTALKEQLGLVLEPTRDLIDVLTVGSLERPSAN